MAIVLEKGESFNYLNQNDFSTKKKLEVIFGKKFDTLGDLEKEISEIKFCLIPREKRIKISTLPFEIKEWDILYDNPSQAINLKIAKIKVVY